MCVLCFYARNIECTPSCFYTPFQKESFCLPKRVLLPSKRSPFALQNESFCNPKGVLFETYCNTVAIWGGFQCYLTTLHLSSGGVQNIRLFENSASKICLFRANDVTLRHKIKSIHTTRVSVSIEGGSFQHFVEGSVLVFTWIVLLTLAVDALIPFSFRFKIALTIAL